MTPQQEVEIDERTLAVANASNTWVLAFTTFALLIDASCRSWFFHEQAWDLLALACVPGLVAMVYQARQKIWGRRIWKARLIVAFVTAIVAAVIAFIVGMTRGR